MSDTTLSIVLYYLLGLKYFVNFHYKMERIGKTISYLEKLSLLTVMMKTIDQQTKIKEKMIAFLPA